MASFYKEQDLTCGKVLKKLILFFLPIAAGTCIQQLYNTVDGLIVGKFVGTIALAAVGGSAAQIINVLIGFFVAVTAGSSVVIAQIYGARQFEDVKKSSGNVIVWSAIVGVALAIIGFLCTPLLIQLLKTPSDTIEGAIEYLRIYFVGVPFILILNMESNILRACGDSHNPFVYMVCACVCNIILDGVFVIVFHWGIAGVAWATVISQVLNMVLLTRKVFTGDDEYRIDKSHLSFKNSYLRNMLVIGIPSGFQSSMYAISNMIIQIFVNSLGTVVVASWSMSGKVDGVYWAISNAMGAAITTFIGQNIGAGKTDRVKKCIRQGLIVSFATTVVLSGAIMLISKPFLGILTDDPLVVDKTFEILKYFVPFYVLWTVIEVFSAVLRGAGDVIRPFVITAIGICIFRIVWMLTVFMMVGTLFSLCISYLVSWAVTGVALLIYYFVKGKQKLETIASKDKKEMITE